MWPTFWTKKYDCPNQIHWFGIENGNESRFDHEVHSSSNSDIESNLSTLLWMGVVESSQRGITSEQLIFTDKQTKNKIWTQRFMMFLLFNQKQSITKAQWPDCGPIDWILLRQSEFLENSLYHFRQKVCTSSNTITNKDSVKFRK